MEVNPPSTASAHRDGQGGKIKLFSCTTCQQRKVKCDKIQPTCSNCAKHHAKCVYVAPTLTLRKKRKLSGEDLSARLTRYERLLLAHGIQTDDSLDHTSTPMNTGSKSEARTTSVVTGRVSSPKDVDGINHDPYKP